jgi:FAD/FMN-containing dehydrogenase/Fe-S oxidoreductase
MPTLLDRAASPLARRLARETTAEVQFDAASRGRYATDASLYQIMPVGVAIPRREQDLAAILAIAREEGVPVLARGGGTSQSGQTVGRALVVDCSKHLHSVLEVDAESRTCLVEPGIVLDALNKELAPSGLWFPVDVSTKSRATIGGMAGNNSCGTRSIRYGVMRDNVVAIDAILADGSEARFSEVTPSADGRLDVGNAPDGAADLMRDLVALGQREAQHLATAFPQTARRVGGYNLDALIPPAARGPGARPVNLATLLVGSEGTLALSKRIALRLSPLPRNKALGICHFPTFRRAMEATRHIVGLGPVAVEVVDRTLIELARDIAMFRPVMEKHVRGKPDALLLTEFAEDEQAENLRRLDRLERLMGDLGLPGAVVKVTNAAEQRALWEVREAGLNIMMSMKSDGKPVSFIEDCAVPLEHLADYTERLTAVFEKHGTKGTWYAHASVGCLHVRPVLNLKLDADVRKMRAIAEEAFAFVREYKGAHSGEHGDGLVRSEFHEQMFGARTVRLFEEVKDRLDPAGVLNPGKIVRPPRMDDRTLFRYPPGYRVAPIEAALDWSGFSGAGGGLQGAIEMCNNNGACRRFDAGVMCPSYRVTREESHVTRGRANALRLAISGQLGAGDVKGGALACDELAEAMALCVSCKGCRRECPTGVDMARLKIEVEAARVKSRGLSLHDRLIAYLPRYAPYASRLGALMGLRDRVPGLPWLSERIAGFSAQRPLPAWSRRPFRHETPAEAEPRGDGEAGSGAQLPFPVFAMGQGGAVTSRGEVVLLADTFNTWFEPENLRAAVDVLQGLGYRLVAPLPAASERPLCCGRTFLSAGLVDEARAEAQRLLAAVMPHVDAGAMLVGIEPSCLLTLRDEWQALRLGPAATRLAERAVLLEELIARDAEAGRIAAPIGRLEATVHLHGHCHQKAFGALAPVEAALRLVDGLTVKPIESSCCGMAGAFGYGAATYDTSLAMGELSLLPAVRAAAPDALIAADGFSCRHQIKDGTGRAALHVARVLREAMAAAHSSS